MSRAIVTPGQIVTDRESVGDHREADVMVVIEPDAGTVAEQDPKTRNAVRNADANEAYDTTDSARCVDVVYIAGGMSEATYTFPRSRLQRPSAGEQTLGYPPAVWAKAKMLVKLYETTELTEYQALESAIEGQVILCATDLLSMRETISIEP
jgi:hypothetical protein